MVDIKKDFPFFTRHPDIAYLDTGATSLKPASVLFAMQEYYETYGVNIHRGIYDLSGQATQMYEAARSKVAKFIHADPSEIVFTSGTTHGLNFLARSLCKSLKPGDNVVLTRMEHHANLIPWQEMKKCYGFDIRFIELHPAGHPDAYTLDIESAKKVIDEHTKIVSVTLMSNVLGTIPPAKTLVDMAHAVGAVFVGDAAQSIAHEATNVRELDCDFLAFSGHKMYGPTGVGVVYGKKKLLETFEPLFFGGDMIRYVSYESAEWNDVPNKFEAGTPPIAEVIGLGAAVGFIESLGWGEIADHEEEITAYALERLKIETKIKIVGPQTMENRSGVISFLIEGVHPHDAGDILGKEGVLVRVGHHCAMPFMQYLGVIGTVRASFGIYTNTGDVDKLVAGIEKVKKIFKT